MYNCKAALSQFSNKTRSFKMKNVWIMDQITLAINAFFVAGITPILLYRWGVIPASEAVVTAYWLVAIISPCVIGLTLIRWVKKFPTLLTWLQGAYGVTAIASWLYSSIVLIRVYSDESREVDGIAALLSVPIIPLSLLAIYLTRQAMKKRYKH